MKLGFYGRPQSSKIPDGAETDYAYTYVGVSGASLGGFGRVETGNVPTTNAAVSQVDTQYAPCGCSPPGKL